MSFAKQLLFFFFFSSRRRHTRYIGDWSSDVCSSDLLDRARNTGNIEFVTPYVVEEFEAGDSGMLEQARLRNVETGEERTLPMAGAFIAIGHVPQSELVQGIVETDANGYVVTEGKSTRTNV